MVTILDKTTSVRKRLFEEIIQEWFNHTPRRAREIARHIKETTAHQYHSSGKWRERGDAYYKISIPLDIMHAARRVFAKLGVQPPPFTDDSDIELLIQVAPDIFKGAENKINRKKRKK